jgi:hypothetical protein
VPLIVKVRGIPKTITTSDQVKSKVLEKKTIGFKISNIYGEDVKGKYEMVWYFASVDLSTVK